MGTVKHYWREGMIEAICGRPIYSEVLGFNRLQHTNNAREVTCRLCTKALNAYKPLPLRF